MRLVYRIGLFFFFFFQAEDGIRDLTVTGVQTCALPISFGYPKDRLKVILVQIVNLLRGGQRVTMSKRAGELITLREVIEEVGADAAKFIFLTRRADSHLDFDLELAKQKSAENPVYYVQYAHARVASLFRVAAERGVPVQRTSEVDWSVLSSPDDLELIKPLAEYPALVEDRKSVV